MVGATCPTCANGVDAEQARERRARARREALIRIVGGSKPFREFTFSRFRVSDANRRAFEVARHFHARRENLYLWGPCAVGKTHLAIAALRRTFEGGANATVLSPVQLTRQLRMRAPDEEQAVINRLATVACLVIEDLAGIETLFTRQILQEIIDRRSYSDRAGLIVTSRESPATLARHAGDEGLASRLARGCQVIEIGVPQSVPPEVGHGS